MSNTAANGTAVQSMTAHCHIDIIDYNYSLFRAVLASCNARNGQPSGALVLIVGFAGAVFWICGELIVQVCSRFSSWTILYPWTILASTLGTVVITVAHILNHSMNAPTLSLGLEATGWIFMVTGFGLVLYSRLHILITNKNILHTILAIVVLNGLLCHTPIIVASVYTGRHKKTLLRAGFCLDVLFVLQENGMALLYIYSFLRFIGEWRGNVEARAILKKLIFAEMVVFCTDIIPLALLYAQAYVPREAIHPLAYAIKLKVEFLILNELVRYSRTKQEASRGRIMEEDYTAQVAARRPNEAIFDGFGYSLPIQIKANECTP